MPMTLPLSSLSLPLPLCHALHRVSCFSFGICISPLTLANRERVLALTHSDTALVPPSLTCSLFVSLSLSHSSCVCLFSNFAVFSCLGVAAVRFAFAVFQMSAPRACEIQMPAALSFPLSLLCSSLVVRHSAWATAQFGDNLR